MNIKKCKIKLTIIFLILIFIGIDCDLDLSLSISLKVTNTSSKKIKKTIKTKKTSIYSYILLYLRVISNNRKKQAQD